MMIRFAPAAAVLTGGLCLAYYGLLAWAPAWLAGRCFGLPHSLWLALGLFAAFVAASLAYAGGRR